MVYLVKEIFHHDGLPLSRELEPFVKLGRRVSPPPFSIDSGCRFEIMSLLLQDLLEFLLGFRDQCINGVASFFRKGVHRSWSAADKVEGYENQDGEHSNPHEPRRPSGRPREGSDHWARALHRIESVVKMGGRGAGRAGRERKERASITRYKRVKKMNPSTRVGRTKDRGEGGRRREQRRKEEERLAEEIQSN
jgi:hypothetical protein